MARYKGTSVHDIPSLLHPAGINSRFNFPSLLRIRIHIRNYSNHDKGIFSKWREEGPSTDKIHRQYLEENANVGCPECRMPGT
jgi:hypothetical protein